MSTIVRAVEPQAKGMVLEAAMSFRELESASAPPPPSLEPGLAKITVDAVFKYIKP